VQVDPRKLVAENGVAKDRIANRGLTIVFAHDDPKPVESDNIASATRRAADKIIVCGGPVG